MKTTLLILLVLTLFSCHQIWSGDVTDKNIEPAYTSTELVSMPCGKTTIFIPQTIYHPEAFAIYLTGKTKKGIVKTEIFYVDEDQYNRTLKGDHLCFKDGCTTRP